MIELCVGLVVGGALTWLVGNSERVYLRTELRAAHNQITGAVFRGEAIVPPRFDPVPPPEPLPPELAELIAEWDNPESRATQEANVRGWLAQGYGIEAIKRQVRAT